MPIVEFNSIMCPILYPEISYFTPHNCYKLKHPSRSHPCTFVQKGKKSVFSGTHPSSHAYHFKKKRNLVQLAGPTGTAKAVVHVEYNMT